MDYHFTDDQVMDAFEASGYITDGVRLRLNLMTTSEKYALYRAIAKLALSMVTNSVRQELEQIKTDLQ